MIKFEYEVEKAMRIVVDIEGDTQKYAMSFLHIFNNARDSKEFYRVENTYDNRVYVTFDPTYRKEMEEYLSQFGKILCVDDVKKINVFPTYSNSKEYNDLFNTEEEIQLYIDDDCF